MGNSLKRARHGGPIGGCFKEFLLYKNVPQEIVVIGIRDVLDATRHKDIVKVLK